VDVEMVVPTLATALMTKRHFILHLGDVKNTMSSDASKKRLFHMAALSPYLVNSVEREPLYRNGESRIADNPDGRSYCITITRNLS